MPNLFEIMLNPLEEERANILELCLLGDLSECLLSPILTPFS